MGPNDRANENDMMDLLGSIAAGECDRVLVIAERTSKAGERTVIVRMGGLNETEARGLCAEALWSKSIDNEHNPDIHTKS